LKKKQRKSEMGALDSVQKKNNREVSPWVKLKKEIEVGKKE
jgi:hypothetical protein